MKVIATYTVLIAVLLLPLFIMAETIIVKTEAPQNRNAVFQYRVPKGYDKNRREMYRVLVIFGGRRNLAVFLRIVNSFSGHVYKERRAPGSYK